MAYLKLLMVSVIIAGYSTSFGQEISVIKFKDFKKLESKQNDTTYIFNFWATWCRPCVTELPYFDKITKMYESEKVKVILVSLDFISQFSSRLLPFVKEKKIISEVVLLNEPDYNSWISKIDSTWSGAIPATLIVNNKNGFRKFFEKEFSENELLEIVKSYHE